MAKSQNKESPELRTPNRFITDHDASGLSVFNTSIPDALPAQVIGGRDRFHLAYATTTSPVDLTNQSDIVTYSSFLSTPPGISLPGGSVLRIVDVRPGGESLMHRTESIDYGVVLDGEIDLVLDSGESRILKRGDVAVQRGTNHLWRNRSHTAWGRMVFVTLEAKPIEIDGKLLGGVTGLGMDDTSPAGN
uniref:Phomopsin biosynthesis cluster protein C' n=1 Tax=Diaporthe leptostromiformis TaxID=291059 RepID=PHOC2_DIALO|nr:RecName: Full=Phomopsin biosynthesis cluster protein C' [Diaporthe leptostromiformis]AMR44274.1 putative cupin domain protein [Diaporthe leptostromiformis]